MSDIHNHQIVEGNLRADKDTGDFGGPNMWSLQVKDKNGRWESVQWMNVYRIQQFFNTKLPVYREISSTKYQLVS